MHAMVSILYKTIENWFHGLFSNNNVGFIIPSNELRIRLSFDSGKFLLKIVSLFVRVLLPIWHLFLCVIPGTQDR